MTCGRQICGAPHGCMRRDCRITRPRRGRDERDAPPAVGPAGGIIPAGALVATAAARGRHAAAVGPSAVRPDPAATQETPLDKDQIDRRRDPEDFEIQIEAARRSMVRGFYATARSELRGAMLILDRMEKRDA